MGAIIRPTSRFSSNDVFENFESGDLSVETLLFQTGYVTIKSRDEFGLYERLV